MSAKKIQVVGTKNVAIDIVDTIREYKAMKEEQSALEAKARVIKERADKLAKVIIPHVTAYDDNSATFGDLFEVKALEKSRPNINVSDLAEAAPDLYKQVDEAGLITVSTWTELKVKILEVEDTAKKVSNS